MSWTELEKTTKAAVPRAPVVVRTRSYRRGGPRLQLNIQPQVMNEVGGGRAMRFRVMVGSGPYSHQIRLVHDERGPFEARQLKSGAAWVIPLPALEWVTETQDPEACSYKANKVEHSLTIDLPRWAWNPASVRVAS